MKSITRLLILFWIGSLQACASQSRPPPADGPPELPDRYTVSFRLDHPPHRTVLSASIDRVEQLVPSVYQHLGLAIGRATSTGEVVFITPDMKITGRLYEGERNSEYIDCGTGLVGVLADRYEVNFAMLTRLREGEDGTTIVETLLGGQARARNVSNSPVDCIGTGKLEQMIADLLRARSRS